MKDFLDARMRCVSADVTVLTRGSRMVLLAREQQSAKPGHQPHAGLAQINQSAPFRPVGRRETSGRKRPPSNVTFPKETWQTSGRSGLVLPAHDNEAYKRISIAPSPHSSPAAMH
jgi:hypothetical protein